MRKKSRRRYKKKYDLILIFKIALCCYLAIFGVGYMTSNTSAYYTSQSEVSHTITGVWEVPVVLNQCGEEIVIGTEQKDGKPKETNDNDAVSSEENEGGCEDKDEELKVEEIEEATEQEIEETNKVENVDDNADSDVNTGEVPETSVDDVEQPEGTEEQKPVDQDSAENKAPEESAKIVGELNTVVTPGENTMKAEGDTNEREKINEKEENNEENK